MTDTLTELGAGDRWLSPPEVADYLGITVRWLYKLIQDGQIEASKPSPRVLRVKKSAADTWMASHATTPPAA